MTSVSLSEARMRLHELLLQERLPAEHARIIEDHFLGNEVLGKSSHGLIRLPVIFKNLRKYGPGGVLTESANSGQSINLDAQLLPGVVALYLAVERMLIRMDETEAPSIMAVGVTNYQFGTGVLGRFAFQIAQAGMIGIAMANSYALVAPPGGREPMIGTNPIAVAIPTQGTPIVVDVSTAATSFGKVAVAMANGEVLSEGLIINAEGQASTDPNDAHTGAMLALGDHKGFGLGLVVEILAGSLLGADAGPIKAERHERNDGSFLLALRPSAFGNNQFSEHVTALAKTIEQSASRSGKDSIRIPGAKYEKLQVPIAWPESIEVGDAIWQDFLRI